MRIAAPAIVLAMAVAACGGSGGSGNGGGASGSSETPKAGGTLTWGADQTATGFNTNTSQDNGTAATNVEIRVLPWAYYFTPDFKTKWNDELFTEEPKQTVVNGKQTVTFTVKPEAKWSDGTPINYVDFKYVVDSINTPGFDVASAAGYEDIESVKGEGTDGKTVVLTFKKNFSEWQGLFHPLLPGNYMTEQGAKLGSAKKGWEQSIKKSLPVSGGPFKVQGVIDQTNGVVTLVRNDAYWGKKPYLDKIIYKTIEDSSQQPAALKNAEADLIYPQPQLDLVNQVRKLENVKSETNFGLSFEHIDMNTQDPILADPKVRKAIAYAIDREAIVTAGAKQFDPRAQILNNHIYVNNQPQYKDNAGDFKTRNVDKAKQLLKDAGWTAGGDGTLTKGGKKLTLRFTTTQGNKLRENTQVLVKSELKEVGIDVTVKNLKSTDFFGTALPGGDFQLALFAWVGNPLAASANKDIYQTATAANRKSNYSLLSDPRVDSGFKQAIGELDTNKVGDELNQVDTYLWEDMVTIPLYQKPTFIAYRTAFGGVADNSTQDGPSWNSEGWYKKSAQ